MHLINKNDIFPKVGFFFFLHSFTFSYYTSRLFPLHCHFVDYWIILKWNNSHCHDIDNVKDFIFEKSL